MTVALEPSRRREVSRQRDSSACASAWLAGFSSPRTRKAYESDLRKWAGWLSGLDVEPFQARRVHVDGWVRSLEESRSAPASISRAIAAVASFYRYALDDGLIERSPVASVRRPKAEPVHQTLGLDRGELAALIAAAEVKSRRDHALVLLLALNGLRISEALSASVADLGAERGHRVLSIVRKGGRSALVPLAPRTAAAIDGYLAGRAHPRMQPLPQDGDAGESVTQGPLFATSSGRPIHPNTAVRMIRQLAKRAGLDKRVTPHSLRHTFVTLALDAGVSLRDVQDAAGHADPRTTRGYDRARFNLDRHPTYAVAASLG